MVDFSLAIPMYNEEAIAEKVITDIQRAFDMEKIDYELVLIDNGSTDKTGSLLDMRQQRDTRVRVLHVQENQGYGWGVIQGLKQTQGNVVGYVDGDGQVPPEDIIKVYKRLKATNSDFAKGTRINRGDGWKRTVASFGYNTLCRIFFFIRARDINGKPKIFSRRLYDHLQLESKDWFIDTEITIKAQQLKYKPQEVIVNFKERKHGKSNVSEQTIKEFVTNLIKWRIRGVSKQVSIH